MRVRKIHMILFSIFAILTVYVLFGLYEGPVCRHYTIKSVKLKNDAKIVVLSDFHSMERQENAAIIELVKNENPDCIFFVGDMFDISKPVKPTVDLMTELSNEYESYFVTGNHETSVRRDEEIESIPNLTWLKNENMKVKINGNEIQLSGIDDFYKNEDTWVPSLGDCALEKDSSLFTILLSHRPEFAEAYEIAGYDLVVCGHTHGGQVRVPPLINGVMAPSQGVFPKYVGGKYKIGNGTMIVSRGLVINQRKRFYNPSEITVINLKSVK